jgi:hypothetical protein
MMNKDKSNSSNSSDDNNNNNNNNNNNKKRRANWTSSSDSVEYAEVPFQVYNADHAKIDIDLYEMPPREVLVKINNNCTVDYYQSNVPSQENRQHKMMKDSRGELLGHLISNATSFEDSLRICEAIFDVSMDRDLPGSIFPGFAMGHQSAKRSRMPILLKDFEEKERFLRLTEENLGLIRKSDPNYARGFTPNVIIAFLATPGATLGVHVNEKSKCPFVASFNFGCTVRFNLENRRTLRKEDQFDSAIDHLKCQFNFKSQDFLTFNGRKTHHGYSGVKSESFCIGKSELYFPSRGVEEPYRLGVVGFQMEDPDSQLVPFFFRGKIQHEPLYPNSGDNFKKESTQSKKKKKKIL